MRSNGGGAHVHRHAPGVFVEAGPHSDDLACIVHSDRDLPLAGTQRGLQALQQAEVAVEVLQAPFALERFFHALQVAGRVMHVRFLHFHVVQLHQRIQLDVPRFGSLAHHLAVHLAGLGNVDDHVGLHLRLARQTAAFGQHMLGAVALFGHRERREAFSRGRDAVLREFAFRH